MTVIFAVSLLVLSALTGAAVSAAQMNSVSVELQDRVDALALTSSLAVRDGDGQGVAAAHADRALAEVMGGIDGSGSAAVEIIDSSNAGVVATMSRDVNVVLGGLLGMDRLRLVRSARALADGGAPVCLHILSESQPEAFSRRGASSLEASNCVAQVNSDSDRALDSRGAGGRVETLRTRVRGAGGPADSFIPTPDYGAPALADPYESQIEWPSAAACSSPARRIKRSTTTIAPGVICGDLDLETGAEVVLLPGIHVITGSLSMGAGARLTAEGVSLVFVGDTSRVDISAQSDARFVAPVEGPWRGIALAVKPQPVELSSTIKGGGAIDLTGVLYLPSQQLHLTGGGRLGEPTDELRMVVVNRLDLNGNGRVWLNGEGSPTRVAGRVRLIE